MKTLQLLATTFALSAMMALPAVTGAADGPSLLGGAENLASTQALQKMNDILQKATEPGGSPALATAQARTLQYFAGIAKQLEREMGLAAAASGIAGPLGSQQMAMKQYNVVKNLIEGKETPGAAKYELQAMEKLKLAQRETEAMLRLDR